MASSNGLKVNSPAEAGNCRKSDFHVLRHCPSRHPYRSKENSIGSGQWQSTAKHAGKGIPVILDNYAAHKHKKVRAWVVRHPRWTFHFTPISSSWLNAVEGFFAKLPADA